MQIRLTVVDPLGTRSEGRAASCDVLVTAPAGTALAAVASGLVSAIGGEGPGVLFAGAERLDAQRCTLGEPPLIDGAVLSVGSPAEPGPEVDAAAARLHVVTGPDAGGVHLLHGGRIDIGRSADADVPLDDPDVSRLHCAVTVAADGRVSVADLGSTNGTTLDGAHVREHPVRLAPGALLRVGESTLRLTRAGDATVIRETAADGEGHVRVLPHAREGSGSGGGGPASLRAAGDASRTPGTTPGAPASSPPGATHHGYGTAGWGAAEDSTPGPHGHGSVEPPVVPGQGGAPEIESTGTGTTDRTDGGTRKDTPTRGTTAPRLPRKRGGLSAWARRLAGARGEQSAATESESRDVRGEGAEHEAPSAETVAAAAREPERWPDPAALLLAALGPGPRLWERDPGHPETLTVRLGTADRSAPDGSGLLPAVPVTAGLREVGALGLAGPRPRLSGLARAVVAQLAALHSPDALEIVLISTDRSRPVEERIAEWSWLGWLPHLRPAHGQDCRLLLAYDREQAAARTEELVRRLEDHLTDAGRRTTGRSSYPGTTTAGHEPGPGATSPDTTGADATSTRPEKPAPSGTDSAAPADQATGPAQHTGDQRGDRDSDSANHRTRRTADNAHPGHPSDDRDRARSAAPTGPTRHANGRHGYGEGDGDGTGHLSAATTAGAHRTGEQRDHSDSGQGNGNGNTASDRPGAHADRSPGPTARHSSDQHTTDHGGHADGARPGHPSDDHGGPISGGPAEGAHPSHHPSGELDHADGHGSRVYAAGHDSSSSTHLGISIGSVSAEGELPAGSPAARGRDRRPSWARDDEPGETGWTGPFTVVVVDGDPGPATVREAVSRLAVEGPRAGIHVVCLAETAAASPASPVTETYEAACAVSSAFRDCGAVALLSGDVATALRLMRVARTARVTRDDPAGPAGPTGPAGPVGHGTVATLDAVSMAWAERFARALAPLRTDGLPGEGHARVSAPLPQAARLLDELGLARATPASLMARWADAADDTQAFGGRAVAVLGAGPRGPACVDLAGEGPHLLIEGPSGSGRTELLRSVAASLAAAERPDRLGIVLVDGRDSTGGSAAARGDGLRVCTDLPHVTTHLAAHDPVRMREFAQSLAAELKRRTELLGRLDFAEWHTQQQLSGSLVSQRSAKGSNGSNLSKGSKGAKGAKSSTPGSASPAPGAADLDAPPSATLRLRPAAERKRTADAGPPLPRLVVIVDDLDALLSPALGSPGRPAAGSVVRALEAVARDGERLGVHLVAATAGGARTADTELARRATLRVVLEAPSSGPEEPAPGRGRLTRTGHGADAGAGVQGPPTPFQGGRVTGRIPRTATVRPTVVPLEWDRMGDPPTRRPVRELGNGPTDLALLASALERAARSVSATEVPSLL
ncbi:FHA domain-containing protein [Streptomyces sporangiiformans]|uniref:FHA domain-containing protein n=1 Tax=Streptomyces sporangiiformans TaxID=2315329 RepID=A0A505DBZ6_9ACTN|nr:FHA domain-containing protein [Streptomyces sporangiiformans]TPQ20200.1 FHA domain-containing protein [Streptomyces sporangiiformans]